MCIYFYLYLQKKACPAMKVAFTIDELPSLLAIVDALDPVLPVYKIRLVLKPNPQPDELDDFIPAAVLSLIMLTFPLVFSRVWLCVVRYICMYVLCVCSDIALDVVDLWDCL